MSSEPVMNVEQKERNVRFLKTYVINQTNPVTGKLYIARPEKKKTTDVEK